MRIGFLMDPLESVLVHHDSTFALMLECRRRGHEVRVFEQRHLGYGERGPRARMRTVELRKDPADHFTVLADAVLPLAELDAIFLRKDPPVDVEFVLATQLVELVGRAGPVLINNPGALRDANEKLFALRFPELVPKTRISHDLAELRAFVEELGGSAIVKPIDGFGGRGVLYLRAGDRNLGSLLELATAGGTKAVIVQQYLAASREGDKRILLVDGVPKGAVLRVPREDDNRANLAVGGQAEKAPLTAGDLALCATLAPALRARGLYFVGIDVIGGKLIEVNVTSPTGIVEVDALDGVSIEADVIDLAERLVAERRR
jgi:glutathione synthase